MEVLKNLIIRLRHAGVLFLIGILLIIYIAFGFLYLQQGSQQKELDEQITKLSLVVSKPATVGEELQAEYDEVNLSLTPMSNTDAIALLVSIAEESGIDVSEAGSKFRVPSAGISQVKVGGGTYRLVSFKNISVQGDYDSVMAFLSDLDSGKTLETMVLRKVATSEKEITFTTGSEGARKTEFREVEVAVSDMMNDNNLQLIPNPLYFGGGVATNLMGDDPDTEGIVEGFPDILTSAAEKGYSGNATPKAGYVLYSHDKISTGDTTQFETISYINKLTTTYYYTCEADGTVRQFSETNVATATEFLDSEISKIEHVAFVDVDIYTLP